MISIDHPIADPAAGNGQQSVSIPKLLVIEGDGDVRSFLKQRFPQPIRVDALPISAVAPDQLREVSYDIIIWIVESHGSAALKLQQMLQLLSRYVPRTQLFIIANQKPEPVSRDVSALSYQYLPQPVEREKLCRLIKSVLEKRSEFQNSIPEPHTIAQFEGLIGMSPPMREVFEHIRQAASTDISVLVSGETGTGKELVAAAIHNRSARKNKPYVPVNTGVIPPELIASELFGHEKGAYTGAIDRRAGLFEQANGGTIFLDEISTMDQKTQIGLLRILETKTFRRVRGDKDIRVDVRVIAATNEDLQQAIQNRHFREDLYYRLDVFHIHLPPLRERPGGVTLLTNHLVGVFNSLYKKDVKVVLPEVYRCLRRYPWPGNVRELKNVIQRAVLLTDNQTMTLDVIPTRIREVAESSTHSSEPGLRPGMTLAAVEKELISVTLAATGGNKKEAALQLGISRRNLYNKLAKYRLA